MIACNLPSVYSVLSTAEHSKGIWTMSARVCREVNGGLNACTLTSPSCVSTQNDDEVISVSSKITANASQAESSDLHQLLMFFQDRICCIRTADRLPDNTTFALAHGFIGRAGPFHPTLAIQWGHADSSERSCQSCHW